MVRDFCVCYISMFPYFQRFLPLSIPSHVLVMCGSLEYGVVLPRAGKLVCGLCSHQCGHTTSVKAGVDEEAEWAADVAEVLDLTKEVEVSAPSLLTTSLIQFRDFSPVGNVCLSCGSDMAHKEFSATVHTFQGSRAVTGRTIWLYYHYVMQLCVLALFIV